MAVTMEENAFAGNLNSTSPSQGHSTARRMNMVGWPMFFRTWGTRICSSQPMPKFETPRLKSPR